MPRDAARNALTVPAATRRKSVSASAAAYVTRMPPLPGNAARAVLAALLSMAFGAGPGHACGCAPVSEQDMIAGASLAVRAEAIADAPFTIPAAETVAAEQIWVTVFRVHEVLAGTPKSARIAVLHTVEPPSCGVRFAAGARYLLAFGTDDTAAPLRVGLCGIAPSDVGKLHVK